MSCIRWLGKCENQLMCRGVGNQCSADTLLLAQIVGVVVAVATAEGLNVECSTQSKLIFRPLLTLLTLGLLLFIICIFVSD